MYVKENKKLWKMLIIIIIITIIIIILIITDIDGKCSGKIKEAKGVEESPLKSQGRWDNEPHRKVPVVLYIQLAFFKNFIPN